MSDSTGAYINIKKKARKGYVVVRMSENNYLKELTDAIKNLGNDVKGMRMDLGAVKEKVKVLETRDDPNLIPRKPGEVRHFHFESHDGSKPPGSILIKEPVGGWDIDAAMKKLQGTSNFRCSGQVYYCYHKNSIAIHGTTMPVRGRLKELGGSWNKTLKAWIFPKAEEKKLKEFGWMSTKKELS